VIKLLKLEKIVKECEICEYYMIKIEDKNIYLVVPKKDNHHEVESIGTESAYL
jgi:RNA polymerase-interacting CarD/CdnL/TRCF family regulator